MKEKNAKILYGITKTIGILNLFMFWVVTVIAMGMVGITNIVTKSADIMRVLYHNVLLKIINDKIGAIAIFVLAIVVILIFLIIMITREHTSFLGAINLCLFLGFTTVLALKPKNFAYYWNKESDLIIQRWNLPLPYLKVFVIAYCAVIVLSLFYFIFSSIYTTKQAGNVVYMNNPETIENLEEEKEEKVKKPAIVVNGKVELGAEIQILAYGHEAYARVTEYDGEVMDFDVAKPEEEPSVEEPVEEVIEEQVEEPLVEETVDEELVGEEPVEEPVEEEIIEEEPIAQESNDEPFSFGGFSSDEDETEEDEDEDEEDEDEEDGLMVNQIYGQTSSSMGKINKVDFDEKVEKASPDLKRHYNEIKNVIMKYRNVHSRISKAGDSFRCKGQKYVYMTIVGKTLKVYLALDPFSIDQNVYHHRDVSNKKKYQVTPTLLRVKSELSVKKTIKLIEVMFEDNMIDVKKKVEEKDYVQELLDILEAKKQPVENQ
ncbi:MAG: hypothetical protein SPI52_01805 [Bacilli bacterium]|nr:hypothetical protein [Bacilli bacterium]